MNPTTMDYNRLEKSAVLAGRPGVFAKPAEFPISNVVISPDLYSYEGNWLFCSFNHPELLAARIGFGKGKIDWRDYGLDEAPMNENALFWRLEVVTAEGIYAHLSSSPTAGRVLRTASDRLEIGFDERGNELFLLSGWPGIRWKFRNPEGSLSVDLRARLEGIVVWPDCSLPHNTFGMCLGTSSVEGMVHIEGREFSVRGSGIYDHPRILVRENAAPPLGWYLYSPVRFTDGTQLACYYSQDSAGKRDSMYSAAVINLADSRTFWLNDCNVLNLMMGSDGLPVQWETRLRGDGTNASLRVNIRQLPLLRGWGDAHPAKGTGKYVAYPLLMDVEGEAELHGERKELTGGVGIAEFLARKALKPEFP